MSAPPPILWIFSRLPCAASLAVTLLALPFTASGQNYTASSNSSAGTITISSGNHTISVGSSGSMTRSNAITLSGGTLQGGIMDNVATVSNLSGNGTSSTNVDANGVTIILSGSGTTDTTADLTLSSGVSVAGANQLLVGGGAGGGGGRGSRNRGGGGGGGFVVLTTGNLTGTLALTAGGGSAGAAASSGLATASGGNSSIGATTASGGGGAASTAGTYPTGKGGNSGKSISGSSSSFTGGNGFITTNTTGNGGGGGGAGSSANGFNGVNATNGGAGGNGTQVTTGVVGLSTYMGSNTFGGGGGGGGTAAATGGGGGGGGGGAGGSNAAGAAGTNGLGGGGGGGGATTSPSGNGGAGGAGSVAIQYAYNSNVAAGNLTLSGGITLSSSSTLDAVRSGGLIDITTTAISGTGSLNIASSSSSGGVVRFSVANTYSGTTTINSGATLELANVNALQNTTLDTGTSGSQVVSFTVAGANTYNIGAIQGGDTLDFGNNTISVGANNASTSFTGTLAGSGGSLTKAGTGTLTLSGASSSYDGTTTMSAGTIQIDHANALGSGGNITFSGGGLKYGTGITTDLSSRIKNSGSAMLVDTNGESITWGTALDSTNAGGLTKNGSGTLTLSPTNSYSGATTINAGTLQIDGNIANSGLVINSGGIVSPGTSAAVDTFGTSSITINGGGYNWTLSTASGAAGTGYDQITSSGALTSLGVLTVNIYGNATGWDNAANYSWDILSAASLSGSFNSNNFAYSVQSGFNGGAAPTGTFSFSNPSDGIIRMTYTAPAASDPLWTGGTGNWSTGFSANVTNGANIAFLGNSGGIATNNISNSTLTTVGDIEFRSGAGAYTLAADAGAAGANGGTALTVNGSIINSSTATQTLNTNLAFEATRTIAANNGNITIGGEISGSGGLTKSGTNQLTLSGNNTYSGATTINDGALRATHSNALGSTAAGTTVASGDALELSGGISIGAEALSLSGTGISSGGALRNISGDNSYAGVITLAAATLINSDTGLLTLSGAISGTQDLTIGGAGNTTITNAIGTSTGTLTKNGAGTLTLSGANSYSGTTTVSAGTLTLSGGSAIVDNGEVSISSGAVLNLGASETVGTIAGAGNIALGSFTLTTNASSNTTLSGVISGSGALTKSGSGTLTLSGANSYTGTTTVSAGRLTLGGGSAIVDNGAVSISSGAVLNLSASETIGTIAGAGNITLGSFTLSTNASSDTTLSGVISGTGALTKNGTGTLTLSGANSYTGATTINAGTLKFQANTFNATSRNYTISSSAVLNLDGANQFAGGNSTISGTGNLLITGGMFQGQATASPTVVGNISLGSGGTIEIASGATIYNGGYTSVYWESNLADLIVDGTLNVADGRTVIVDALTGTGTIDKTINTGTVNLRVGVDNGTGTFSGTIKTTTGNISLTKNGTGTQTLSGNNTYTGTTTINAGTLALSGGSAIANNGAVTLANATSTALNVNSSETIGNLSGGGSLGGNIAIASGQTLTVNQTSSLSYNGSISGDGGLTINGTSQLLLGGSNSFTGMTTVNAGTLRLQGSSTSTTIVGDITVTGGTLTFAPAISHQIADTSSVILTGGNFNLSTSADTINSINMSGGTLNRGGATLTLNSASSFTGGTIDFSSASASRITTSGLITLGNTTFDLSSASISSFDQLRLGGDILVNANTTANFTNSASGRGQIGMNAANLAIDVGTGATLNMGWAISGSSVGITKNGSGSLVLTANNTYTGATTINNGTLSIGSISNGGVAGTLGNSTNAAGNLVFGGGELAYTGSTGSTDRNFTLTAGTSSTINVTQSGTSLTISGATASTNGSLTKAGSGTLILSGANAYTGTTTVNAGTLTLGANQNLGAIAGAGALDLSSFALTTNASSNTTYSGAISGTGGALTKNGSGTLTLSGSNTYTGATTINAGTLVISGNTSSSAAMVNSGGTLMGSGSLGATTVNGIIAPGNSPGILTVGDLTLNSGGTYIWEMADATGVAGTGWDQIVSTGLLTVGSTSLSTFTINITSTGSPTNWSRTTGYTWDIIDYGTISGFAATKFTLNTANFFGSTDGGSSWVLSDTGSVLRLTYSYAVGTPTWSGGSGNWSTGFAPAISSGNNAIFDGAAGGTATNDIDSATLSSIGSLTFNSTAGAYTLAANSGSSGFDAAPPLIVTGSIVNNSTAAQTINLAMTFSGTRVVDTASGNISLGGVVNGSGGVTKNGTGTLTLSAANTFSGGVTLNQGQLNLNAATAPGNGTITIVSGTLDNTSSGAITLSNNNAQNWNGNFEFLGTQDLNMGTGSVAMDAPRTVTITAGNLTVGGVISGATFGLTKAGAGTLILGGANTYNGTTTVSAGTLAVGNVNALQNTTLDTGTSGSQAVTFTVGGTNTYNLGGLQGSDALNIGANSLSVGANNADTVFNGVLSGTGNFTKTGSGSLTLGAANTISTGTISLGAGTTLIGDNAAFGMATLKFGVSGSTAFTIASTDSTDRTISNSLGTGISGVSTITFGQASGGTGNLTFSNSGSVSLNNASRTFNVVNTTTITGALIHSGASLVKNGAGTLVLLGNNTYGSSSGATTINAGTLQLGNGGTSGSLSSVAITNNGTLSFNRSNSLTHGIIISGTGVLIQNGAGNLTLNAANTYSGGTTLNTGTLVIGNAAAAGTGTITQSSGSSLLQIDTTGTIANNMSVYNVLATQSATLSGAISVQNANWEVDAGDTLTISGAVSGNGGVTKNGDGTLILSGSNSYLSATTVNAGTLEAADANALGANTTVQLNGGSLLVTADDALSGKNITLASTANGSAAAAGLAFSGTYNGTAGSLTLSENSTIDLGTGSIAIHFSDLAMGLYKLAIYNWTGTTLWGGGNGNNTDQFYVGRNLTNNELNRISFYSSISSSSFVGTGFQLSSAGSFNQQIIPVPEPETYAVAVILLLGLGIYALRRSPQAQDPV